ncbi:MAG: ligase-associated DNA damage response endonuclease PdeM [Alphaproteobacteria bacterium]|nr:ligase-associated DNA damage response endonuclease PdeM [Alphaproteobacteria bacterium]
MTRGDDIHIDVNGERLLLDPLGAAYWPAEQTLVFADLHFEKGSSYARGGQFLPPYDTRATIRRIAAALSRHQPGRVIALGDSFHDNWAGDRLDGEESALLAAFVRGRDWIWVEGNHDPEPPTWLGGMVSAEVALGGLVFRHEPAVLGARGEVAGHLHPAVSVHRRGIGTRRRCFVSDGTRLVLPAFGAYTGGLDTRDRAVTSLFEGGFSTYALGRERVYAVGHAPRRKKNVDIQPMAMPKSTVTRP